MTRKKHCRTGSKLELSCKVWRKVGFRDHLLINVAGTTEWTKFVKAIENVEIGRKNTQPVPMDFSAMGSQDQVSRKLFMVWSPRSHGKRVSEENRILATLPNKARAGQRHGQRRGHTRQRQKEKETWQGKGKNKNKKKGCPARQEKEERITRGHKTHKPVKITQSGRTRVGITLTTGMTQTGGQTIGAQICGSTLQGKQAARQLALSQPAQEQSDPTHGGFEVSQTCASVSKCLCSQFCNARLKRTPRPAVRREKEISSGLRNNETWLNLPSPSDPSIQTQ